MLNFLSGPSPSRLKWSQRLIFFLLNLQFLNSFVLDFMFLNFLVLNFHFIIFLFLNSHMLTFHLLRFQSLIYGSSIHWHTHPHALLYSCRVHVLHMFFGSHLVVVLPIIVFIVGFRVQHNHHCVGFNKRAEHVTYSVFCKVVFCKAHGQMIHCVLI